MSEAERGVVCCFCGEAWGYVGDNEPSREKAVADAAAHEGVCPRNPYLARLRESEAREAALVAGLREIVDAPEGTEEPHETYCDALVGEGGCDCVFGEVRALLREHEQRREQRQGGTTT